MKKPYQTTPGTLPHRAVEYLREHGATSLETEIATCIICDDLETDAATFGASMKPARLHGVVVARTVPGRGRTFWWSLGDGVALPLPDDFTADKPLTQRGKSTSTPFPPALFPAPEATSKPELQVPTFRDAVREVAKAFRAALWSDGSLVLIGAEVRDDGTVVLGAKQTLELRRLVAWSAPA